MKKIICYCLLILTSCVNHVPNRSMKSQVDSIDEKVIEIDSMSYLNMDQKISKLDYYDTTDQNDISDSKLIDDYFVFLSREVNNYNMYKRFFNEMTSSRDTIFILNRKQNFYRYIKKDSKTKLIFDSYIEDTRSLPKKLKSNILNLTSDRSKPLVISDSTFSRSIMINFKGDSINNIISVYYLD